MGRTLVIGGGAIGLSVTYHLTRRGITDILLLERNQLTSGTTWHAAGIVGPLRSTVNMTRLASYALDVFPALEEETGMSTGYRRTGGYWLAREQARLDELHRIADLGLTQGLQPRIIPAQDIHLPGLDLSDHLAALYVPEDATVNPVDLCMAYAKGARRGGAEIREGVRVAGLTVEKGRSTGVRLDDGTIVNADTVILCTGAWSRKIAASVGVPLPLQAVEHMYVVTEPVTGLPDPFPVIRDLDHGIYVKGDAGRLVIGGFEPDAKCWDPYSPEGDRAFLELAEDWDQFGPFMDAALDLLPDLEHVGIQRFMNGPESFTNDTRPLIGEAPQVDRLFVAAGMNSVGVMSSAGIGRILADWVVDGHPPMDMWEVDLARVDPLTARPAHMAVRMQEAVSDLMSLHWPYKQPVAGRGLRKSALHDYWAREGAVFGLTAGWERGLWYARKPSERDLPYSVGEQPWQHVVKREAAAMATGATLVDLSPFTKLDIFGDDALGSLNILCTAHMDVPLFRTVYTQLLNQNGGIEADVTITRLGRDRFHLVSGAATRMRDLAYLRRNLEGSVGISDLTDEFCTIGVMGAGSRDLLRSIADVLPEIDVSHCGESRLAGVACRLVRVSFVGELGYEITMVADQAGEVFDALAESGVTPMGHFALEGCRIEKGYRHWGHDLGPDMTPMEAGLAFTIDWEKEFIGKSRLLRQRMEGVRQRLVLLNIESGALMLHDEPIHEDEGHVGLTTSGAVGPRTGLNLAFGLVSTSRGETLEDTCARRFHVRVAGKDYAARPLLHAPFDPGRLRMSA